MRKKCARRDPCKTTRPSHIVKLSTNSFNISNLYIILQTMSAVHCICLQETHLVKYQARPNIPGMTLVAERPHNMHGSSAFVRDGLKVNSISVCEEVTVIELITVELPGVVVHSMYKPHLNHSNSIYWDKEPSLTS